MSPAARNINKANDEKADFEAAVAATGFGKFNFILILTAIPTVLTTNFEMSSLSFVFPAAQCDLNLNIEDKGFINGTIYAGMIASCFIWGPLIDVFGRRKILIIGHFVVIFFIVMVMFSTSFTLLLVAKFMGGFIITGPSAALSPYLSEFHGKRYRSRIQLCIGLLYSVSNAILPLVAWAVLPLKISYNFFNIFEFHSWNVFLLVCTIPALLSGIVYIFMPESPKYLMTKGRNDAAMEVFQKIYSLNSGKPKIEYPILKLVEEKSVNFSGNHWEQGWRQISPLFSSKHAYKLFLTCFLQTLVMICLNSVRLWFPQLFQSMNEYQEKYGKEAHFCAILAMIKSSSEDVRNCSAELDSSIFLNTMIVGISTTIAYIAATFVITRFSKKKFMFVLTVASSLFYYSLYFSSGIWTLILICGYFMTACVYVDVLITSTIDLFPTSLRGSAFSMGQMCGRGGSLIGNFAFPFLVQIGCAPPVFTFGSMLALCSIFSILLPNTDMKSLE